MVEQVAISAKRTKVGVILVVSGCGFEPRNHATLHYVRAVPAVRMCLCIRHYDDNRIHLLRARKRRVIAIVMLYHSYFSSTELVRKKGSSSQRVR